MDIDSIPTVDVDVHQVAETWDVDAGVTIDQLDLKVLPIKRPYLINLNNVEFIEGDWNEDKSEYGIRIGYVSGKTKCFWGATARKVIERINEGALTKFDDRVKAGPPAV